MKKIWVNGCFDIIHRGHIELFKYAKSLGDFLIVGTDTDGRVERSKGQGRPFNCLNDRVFVLESIKYIDKVVSFNSGQELEALVETLKPDIMVVGDDWRGKNIIAGHLVDNILYFSRIGGYSTTRILENG